MSTAPHWDSQIQHLKRPSCHSSSTVYDFGKGIARATKIWRRGIRSLAAAMQTDLNIANPKVSDVLCLPHKTKSWPSKSALATRNVHTSKNGQGTEAIRHLRKKGLLACFCARLRAKIPVLYKGYQISRTRNNGWKPFDSNCIQPIRSPSSRYL
jgi:hypothetical protein